MVEQIIINTFLISIFSLIFVGINIIVGIKIILKYTAYRASIFLLIGTAWLGMSFPWMPETLKVFFMLFNISIDAYSLMLLYLIVNILTTPWFLPVWVISINKLTSLKRSYKRILLLITLILVVLFEILILSIFVINPSLLLQEKGIAMERYTVFWRFFPISVFQIILITIVLVTGLIFVQESLNSEKNEVHLKGKFFLIAFISFTSGGIIDAVFDVTTLWGTIFKIVARIILMSSAIEFYLGYILPESIKEIFIK
jgi:hypothetical protein